MRLRDEWPLLMLVPYIFVVSAMAMMLFPEKSVVEVLFFGWTDINFFRVAIQMFFFIAPIFAVGYIASTMMGKRGLIFLYRHGCRRRWYVRTCILCLVAALLYISIAWLIALAFDRGLKSGIPLVQAGLSLAHTGLFLLICIMVTMLLQLYVGNKKLALSISYLLVLVTEIPLGVIPNYLKLPIHYPMLARSAAYFEGGYSERQSLIALSAILFTLLLLGLLLKRRISLKES